MNRKFRLRQYLSSEHRVKQLLTVKDLTLYRFGQYNNDINAIVTPCYSCHIYIVSDGSDSFIVSIYSSVYLAVRTQPYGDTYIPI